MTLLVLLTIHLSAQQKTPLKELTGEYQAGLAAPITCRIRQDDDKLILQILGQGKTGLTALNGLNFSPKQVKPIANLQFLRDSSGKIDRFRWTQKGATAKWIRTSPKQSNGPTQSNGPAGTYQMNGNPYKILNITEDQGSLKASMFGDTTFPLTPIPHDRFRYKGRNFAFSISFSKDGRQLTTSDESPIDFMKVSSELPHLSARKYGFTRADSLQGALTPPRTCYDVLFYDLNIKITPESKSISGSTAIRFRAVRDFSRMQIDLYANMKIEKILFHEQELLYTREYNAVFVQFPAPVPQGSQDEITVLYSGHPLEPDIDAEKGGWFWLWNREHKMWIETVSQGIGASVWWPCKDHLSDRPDSMKISITYPNGPDKELSAISNGRLLARTDLPDGHTRCDWYVSYPINSYDVVINIGDYAHFSDTTLNGQGVLALNFYCLRYNQDIAKRIFSVTKPMMALYEKIFGPYPFRNDGFTLMESVYPMEHQGAVSIGPINSPFNSTSYDSSDLVRTLWHESAHEWWGNSVGCKDYADMWIHESFATYAEFLNYESVSGTAAALKYLHSDPPKNQEPIIGVYDVNNFHMGDMYPKGALMLHTLRQLIGNDSSWFSMLRGIQERFRYQTITTEDITGYFNAASGKDYTWFFDQYLRNPSIPVLMLSLQEEGPSLKIKYRWQADAHGFCMPIKLTVSGDKFMFIAPTKDWQTMELKGMNRKDFKVDTENFYLKVQETGKNN